MSSPKTYTMSPPRNPRTIDGLADHAGEWVAILNDSVIESAGTLSDLRERIKGQQIDGILRVAPRRRGAGIFL